MSRQPVIISGTRTAVGEFGCSLKDVGVLDLGALVIREADGSRMAYIGGC